MNADVLAAITSFKFFVGSLMGMFTNTGALLFLGVQWRQRFDAANVICVFLSFISSCARAYNGARCYSAFWVFIGSWCLCLMC